MVTTHEQTRAGFLNIALEKNKVGDPYVKNALAFKVQITLMKLYTDIFSSKGMPLEEPCVIESEL